MGEGRLEVYLLSCETGDRPERAETPSEGHVGAIGGRFQN